MKADAGPVSVSTGVPEIVSVLPLRDAVLFPYAVMPLGAGRESSVRLIEDAMSGSRTMGAFGQLVAAVDAPQESDLHRIGTYTTIHKVFKQPDGSVRLAVQGITRIRLIEIVQTRPFLRARVEEVPDIMPAPEPPMPRSWRSKAPVTWNAYDGATTGVDASRRTTSATYSSWPAPCRTRAG